MDHLSQCMLYYLYWRIHSCDALHPDLPSVLLIRVPRKYFDQPTSHSPDCFFWVLGTVSVMELLNECGPELCTLLCAAKTLGVLAWWYLLWHALDWVSVIQIAPGLSLYSATYVSFPGRVCTVPGSGISMVNLPLAWLQTARVLICVSGWQEGFWGCRSGGCVSHIMFTPVRCGELWGGMQAG